MMKAVKMIIPAAVALVFLMTAFAPSVSADTVDYDRDFTFHHGFVYQKVDLKDTTQLAAHFSDAAPVIYICTEEQFNAFQENGGSYPESVKTVENYESVGVSGTYWAVVYSAENSATLEVRNNGVAIETPMSPMDKLVFSFTMVQQTKCSVDLRVVGNTSTVYILITDEHNLLQVFDNGVKNFGSKGGKAVEYYGSGTGEEFNFSTTVRNTANYVLVIESEAPQTVHVEATVSGAADFINSTALSIFLIVFAVAVVGALMYVAMKKIL